MALGNIQIEIFIPIVRINTEVTRTPQVISFGISRRIESKQIPFVLPVLMRHAGKSDGVPIFAGNVAFGLSEEKNIVLKFGVMFDVHGMPETIGIITLSFEENAGG